MSQLSDALSAFLLALAEGDGNAVDRRANAVVTSPDWEQAVGRLGSGGRVDLTAATLMAARLHRCRWLAQRSNTDVSAWLIAQGALEALLESYLERLMVPAAPAASVA